MPGMRVIGLGPAGLIGRALIIAAGFFICRVAGHIFAAGHIVVVRHTLTARASRFLRHRRPTAH